MAAKNFVTWMTKKGGANGFVLVGLAWFLTGCSQQAFTARADLSPAVTAKEADTPVWVPVATPTPNPTEPPTTTPPSTPDPTSTPKPTPPPFETCLEATRAEFEKNKQAYLSWYGQHGGRYPLGDAQPQFRKGTNGRAVVLVHGFLASPAYMKELADGLTQEGYTIFMPLMLGFGANATAANATNDQNWRISILEAVNFAKRCHSDVSVIAHSLGAGLTTDLVVNRGLTGLSKLVLLAPYYRIANVYIQSILDTVGTFTDSVSIKDFEAILPAGEDAYEILGLSRPMVGEAAPYLPIDATQKVLDLQKTFDATVNGAPVTGPSVLMVLTEKDELAKASYAQYYAGRRFATLTQMVYPESYKIPHSFQLRANNPLWSDLYARISSHLTPATN